MHEIGFTKLFNTIITSTIWQEDKATKILWITLLALANRYGEVGAAEPGLARAAGLGLNETLKALKKLSAPDKFSRNKDHEGRRIAKIEGGWQILNYTIYRIKMRRRDAEYYRNYRASKRNTNATIVTPPQPIAEAEAEESKEPPTPLKQGGGSFSSQIRDECFKQGISEDVVHILKFCKKNKINGRHSVTAFITAWRLNPIRQKILLNCKAAKTESQNSQAASQYKTALHETIKAFEVKSGVKMDTLLKNVPEVKSFGDIF